MSGKTSRDKGKRGEREIVAIVRAAGFECSGRELGQERDGGIDVIVPGPDLAIQVKRTERLALPAAIRQAERECPPDHTPLVAHRRSREPWYCTVRLDRLLELLGEPKIGSVSYASFYSKEKGGEWLPWLFAPMADSEIWVRNIARGVLKAKDGEVIDACGVMFPTHDVYDCTLGGWRTRPDTWRYHNGK